MLAGVLSGGVGLQVGCSGKHPAALPGFGSVGLAITLSPGIPIGKVDYAITGSDIDPITGSIDVSRDGATVSTLVNGLPAGPGYEVQMTAVSDDNTTSCAGSATFGVEGGQTSQVFVVLLCHGPSNRGGIIINGQFDNCPQLTSYGASPLTAPVGASITMLAAASDRDAGDVLTFSWSATTGPFLGSGEANTTYTCSVPGIQTITLAVSDGKCSDSATFEVTCVQSDAGAPPDGPIEPAAFLVTTTCPVTIDSTISSASMFDDVTDHHTTIPAVEVGGFSDCSVQRTFSRPIASIKVSILEGSTVDDTGFVGTMMVTAQHQDCAGPADVVTQPLDVTSQVIVAGATASFLLRAQETCCCFTGWGDLSAPNPPPGAKMHWQVILQDPLETAD